MATEKLTDLIRDAITTDALADYLTGESFDVFGVYPDGTTAVGGSVGAEKDETERPIAVAKCPGLANLDMTYWRRDLDREEGMTDEEVIRYSCENGDVTGEIADLVAKLIESLED